MAARDEILSGENSHLQRQSFDESSVDHLFFGRRPIRGEAGAILIGPKDSPDNSLAMTFDSDEVVTPVLGGSTPFANGVKEDKHVPFYRFMAEKRSGLFCRFGPTMRFFPVGDQVTAYFVPPPTDLSQVRPHYLTYDQNFSAVTQLSIQANGLDSERAQLLWDGVSLSTHEHDVIQAIQLVAPSIERLAFKERNDGVTIVGDAKARERIPFVKIKDQDDPIPLRTMGDGVYRLFGMILSLVHVRNGLLLIDEVENGIPLLHPNRFVAVYHQVGTKAKCPSLRDIS